MDAVSNQYRVRTCSECLGDAYYFCKSSGCDICTECSKEYENKNYAYKTKARDLILYREKLTIHPFQETCMRHSENVYENYCKLCEFPFCSHCTEHRMHGQTDLKTAYDTKRQQNENIVNLEKRLQECILSVHPSIVAEIDCRKHYRDQFPYISKKAQRLKQHIAIILRSIKIQHSCLKQNIRQKRRLARIQGYEKRLEQSAIRPVQFLLFKHKTPFPKTEFAPHTNKLHITETLNKGDVLESFRAIKIIGREKRKGLELDKLNNLYKQILNICENPSIVMQWIELCFSQINLRDAFNDRSEFGPSHSTYYTGKHKY